MLLYYVAALAGRATPLARRQNLISKSHSRALPRRFNSRSPVQPTVILDSTEVYWGLSRKVLPPGSSLAFPLRVAGARLRLLPFLDHSL
jgi:hypothetical protein